MQQQQQKQQQQQQQQQHLDLTFLVYEMMGGSEAKFSDLQNFEETF